MKNLRIVFMGTPEFAVASLGALLMNNFDVVGVVTAPDKPAGRGRQLKKSAVAKYAISNYLDVYRPSNLKDREFIRTMRELKADMFVVVAFRMLPEELWRIPPLGTFNLHASLLPYYRGAAPINHAIINGELKTGVTTFLIDKEIDTGMVLLQKEIAISQDENAGELHDKLMRAGARLVVRTVKLLSSGDVKPRTQDEFILPGKKIKPAPKIFSKDCYIEWDNDPENIYNFIRGLSPAPGARTLLKNGDKTISLKVLECEYTVKESGFESGSIISDNAKFIRVACRSGYVEIIKLQPEGKKKMKTSDFIRGFDISGWEITKSPQA